MELYHPSTWDFVFSYPDVSFLGAEFSWIQLAGDGLPANGASNQRPGAGKMGKMPAIQNLLHR